LTSTLRPFLPTAVINLLAGPIYILNTGDWHGTSNDGNSIRTHMITRIDSNAIMQVINMANE
jgi:hypothetical protein